MSQSDSTRLILVAHAPLATAFHDLVLHVFPECGGDVDVLDVRADATLEVAVDLLRGMLASQPRRPTLLLVDVQGATPANAAASVLKEFPEARAVAGMNAPMLWRTLCYRAEPPALLAERAVTGGQRGVLSI